MRATIESVSTDSTNTGTMSDIQTLTVNGTIANDAKTRERGGGHTKNLDSKTEKEGKTAT